MNVSPNSLSVKADASGLTQRDRRARYEVAEREATKLRRLELTDAIKEFSEYVDPQGNKSEVPARAYGNFTRQIYAPFGLNKAKAEGLIDGRDDMDRALLSTIALIESAAAKLLRDGMAAGASRAEIKVAFKKLVERLATAYHQVDDGDFFKKEAK